MKSIITNMLLLCLSILLVGSMAQVSHYGPCRIIEPMKNFEINNFMGTWYGIKGYPIIYETHEKCNSVNFTRIDNNEVLIERSSIDLISGAVIRSGAVATLTNNPAVAKLSSPFLKFIKPHTELITLDTDYKNFAIQHMCQSIGVISLMYIWILSRDRKLDHQSEEYVNNYLYQQVIPTLPLWNVDQDDCPDTLE
ncbi:hypothetical protein PV327_007897 [Microctonus hyperodae]|uniref:Lipocalin/cytosolic fatty-acid binding domain-containing protein n=1 Tax=Microctonus hyperodae TaxID=165561 RepID=A0AA39G057_MICHY|nr:hypothetical protein PV327_007897 [Microctonus hyperodae]